MGSLRGLDMQMMMRGGRADKGAFSVRWNRRRGAREVGAPIEGFAGSAFHPQAAP
jgi:hypothetical protein